MGGFDGIHLGHQALIRRLLLSAKEKKAPSCLCVFDPLPFQFFNKKPPFKRLFNLEETQDILEPFGLDFLCVIPFNDKLSKLNPQDFIRSFIIKRFRPLHIVVGYDFTFAHQRAGDFSTLKNLAQKLGFSVERVEAFLHKKKPVSSSRIRKSLALSHLEELKKLLGRPFSIQSQVLKGEGRGKKLGFPTANLQAQNKELAPLGVYGGKAQVESQWHPAVINIGQRPTFASKKPSLLTEAHILFANLDLYGQTLKLELDFFIREEKAFSGVSALKKAIKQDIEQVLSHSK